MSNDRQGPLDRLWHGSLLVLGAMVALYYAAQILASVWHILLAIGAVFAGLALLVWALRVRGGRW